MEFSAGSHDYLSKFSNIRVQSFDESIPDTLMSPRNNILTFLFMNLLENHEQYSLNALTVRTVGK